MSLPSETSELPQQYTETVDESAPLAPPLGVLLLIAATLIIGIIAGGIFRFVSDFAYVAILAAVFFALASSLVLAQLLDYLRQKRLMILLVRSSTLIALAGMLMGLALSLTPHIWNFYAFRDEVYRQSRGRELDFDGALVQATGQSGLLGYWLYIAENVPFTVIGGQYALFTQPDNQRWGIRIEKQSADALTGERPSPLGTALHLGYWLTEAVVIVTICWVMALRTARALWLPVVAAEPEDEPDADEDSDATES